MQHASARLAIQAAIIWTLASAPLLISIAQSQTTPSLSAPKFLYSTDLSHGKVRVFLVNPTSGALTGTGQGPVSGHFVPTRVASDKRGYRLYVINQNSSDLNAYFINRSNGYLSHAPGSPFAIGHTPTDIKVHPAGHYVYVTAQSNWMFAFHVRSNGSLAAVAGSPFATVNKPQALEIDPQGKYLYVSSYPASSTPATSKVEAFTISSTDGALTPIAGSPYVEPNSQSCSNGAWDMAIHPSGNFLILPNMCEGLVVYGIDRATGSLTLIKGSPFAPPGGGFAAGGNVDGIAMDPRGVYFWVTDEYCSSGCTMTTDTWKLNNDRRSYLSREWHGSARSTGSLRSFGQILIRNWRHRFALWRSRPYTSDFGV